MLYPEERTIIIVCRSFISSSSVTMSRLTHLLNDENYEYGEFFTPLGVSHRERFCLWPNCTRLLLTYCANFALNVFIIIKAYTNILQYIKRNQLFYLIVLIIKSKMRWEDSQKCHRLSNLVPSGKLARNHHSIILDWSKWYISSPCHWMCSGESI